MAKLIVRHPPSRKILNTLLFCASPFLVIGLLMGLKEESFWMAAVFAMIFVIPTAIIVILFQRVFVFDELTKKITIYRTIYPMKKVHLDGSLKKYSLSLEEIYMYRGTVLALLLKEDNKTIYKIAEGLRKKPLTSLAARIQKVIGCAFHDKSENTGIAWRGVAIAAILLIVAIWVAPRWASLVANALRLIAFFFVVFILILGVSEKLRARKQKSKSLEFTETIYWVLNLKQSDDFHKFIRRLSLLFPNDAILYSEWQKIPAEIKNFFQVNQAKNISEVSSGILWPKPKKFHVPLETKILGKISDLAMKYHLFESCNYFAVYKDREELLIGPDISDTGEVYISNKIDEELIKKFCAEAQCKYKKSDTN